MLTIQARIDTGQTDAALAALANLDLTGPLDAGNDALLANAQPYPPERPGQRYVRTNDLRDAWAAVQPSGRGRSAMGGATNTISYGPYVIGNDDQAEVHAGRWRTEDKISVEAEPAVVSAVEARLDAQLPRD